MNVTSVGPLADIRDLTYNGAIPYLTVAGGATEPQTNIGGEIWLKN